ncbi:DoxX family protein [Massilia sp. DD77]|uniref:DoxX family protein n=1 Tax=Massilia sp. DD77 TaxID=3109349 RepID=UPI002FFF4E0C
MTVPQRIFLQARPAGTTLVVRLCLLLLCAAYLQGGLEKALDFPAAVAEMAQFGLRPPAPLALLAIAGELGASVLVVGGWWRWAGAAWLALFTLAANGVANRWWELAGPARRMAENGFFEHLGLAGAFLLVAWLDLQARRRPGT